MMRTGRKSLITTLKKAHQGTHLSFIFIFGKGIIKNAHLHCSGTEAEEDEKRSSLLVELQDLRLPWSVFTQESFRLTVRLKTGAPG